MNKYQEALNWFVDLLRRDVVAKQNAKILQELVDKETPMKPTVDIYRGREVIGCGVCGEVAMDEYCTGCGQKIDWRK